MASQDRHETAPAADAVDLSVVICVLDGRDVIGVQLQALRAQQTDLAWEVVVADNGSSDGTVEFVRSLADGFPVPLRVVDASQQRGAGAARNVGVLRSRGRRIAFCDSDDMVAPGWVQAAHDALDVFDAVGGQNRELRDPFDPDAPVTNPGCIVEGSYGRAVLSGNAAFRRETFFAAGGFDTSLPAYGIEDFEFSIRLNTRAHAKIGPAPDMLMYFRPTTDSRARLRKVWSAANGEVVVWHRHPELYARLSSLPRLVRRVLTLPVGYAASAARRDLPGRDRIARDVVTRIANVFAEVGIRSGRVDLGAPSLLTPQDDPIVRPVSG